MRVFSFKGLMKTVFQTQLFFLHFGSLEPLLTQSLFSLKNPIKSQVQSSHNHLQGMFIQYFLFIYLEYALDSRFCLSWVRFEQGLGNFKFFKKISIS